MCVCIYIYIYIYIRTCIYVYVCVLVCVGKKSLEDLGIFSLLVFFFLYMRFMEESNNLFNELFVQCE